MNIIIPKDDKIKNVIIDLRELSVIQAVNASTLNNYLISIPKMYCVEENVKPNFINVVKSLTKFQFIDSLVEKAKIKLPYSHVAYLKKLFINPTCDLNLIILQPNEENKKIGVQYRSGSTSVIAIEVNKEESTIVARNSTPNEVKSFKEEFNL